MERADVSGLSGLRFSVVYRIAGTEEEARSRAEDIRYEQTVEFPADLTPPGDISELVVGRVERVSAVPAGGDAPADSPSARTDVEISYAVETAGSGGDIAQFLNVVYGNVSIKPGIRVQRLILPTEFLASFSGPRFGRKGLRDLLGVRGRPLVCTALKPMGLSSAALAELAYRFALGGIDIVKDDHGLADQPFSPFAERVARCADAVARANARTGRRSIYMPNVTGPFDLVMERCAEAKSAGAGGILVCPGLTGLDAMRVISAENSLSLPVMAHPAFLGSYVTSETNGFSHYALYGQLMRLAGADATVFPNYGGRFSFTREECAEIARGCSDPMGTVAPIFPTPGGGMTLDRVRDMVGLYGGDFIILMGGGLHRSGPDLAANSLAFISMLEEMGE
jgi:ribulose-bisphosphate carboxylase large chain